MSVRTNDTKSREIFIHNCCTVTRQWIAEQPFCNDAISRYLSDRGKARQLFDTFNWHLPWKISFAALLQRFSFLSQEWKYETLSPLTVCLCERVHEDSFLRRIILNLCLIVPYVSVLRDKCWHSHCGGVGSFFCAHIEVYVVSSCEFQIRPNVNARLNQHLNGKVSRSSQHLRIQSRAFAVALWEFMSFRQ